MKIKAHFLVAVVLSLSSTASHTQALFGSLSRGVASQPFGKAGKIFAEYPAFSSAYELQSKSTSSIPALTMSGTVARLDAKWRLQIDLGKALTNRLSIVPFTNEAASNPDEVDSLTNLTVILVWRPDMKVVWRRTSYYPGQPADGYFEERLQEPIAAGMEITTRVSELGRQAVDGHPCVINKFMVADQEGKPQEYTVWNAMDLNRFPVRIEWVEGNATNIMLLKDVKLDRPDASLFDPPGSKKYNTVTLALDILKTIRSIKKEGATPNTR